MEYSVMVFILLIFITFCVENHALCASCEEKRYLRCIFDYVWGPVYAEVFQPFEDEKLPIENHKSKKETDELPKLINDGFSKIPDELQMYGRDEAPPSKFQKCDVNLLQQLVHDYEILQNKVEKLHSWSASPVTNINITHNLPSNNFVVLLVLLVFIVILVFIATAATIFFFKKKENIRESVTRSTERSTHQDDEENTVSTTVWTDEDVFDYLIRLAQSVSEEYPYNEDVAYLTDEFLTVVTSCIIEENLFERVAFITPYDLLKIAKYREEKSHDGRKQQIVHVTVKYDEK